MYQAISLLETLMKHSDIQEILDFFFLPRMLQLICYFDEAFGLIFDYLREKFQERKKLSLHMKGIRGAASKH